MSRLTPRRRWQQAITSDAFPRTERVVRGTLLCLVELMTPTGELRVWRDEMVDATGLPPRTLNRHLQRAIDLGWLVREVPGGNGRRSEYLAQIPGSGLSSAPEVAHNFRSCEPLTRTQLPEVVGHLVAHSKKKSTHVSEYLAVDDHRGTRPNHDEDRVSPLKGSAKNGSNEDESPATPLKRPSFDSTGNVA
jgi:hypothetical protein